MKKLRKEVTDQKPWIQRKGSGREGKEAWWKACELAEPMKLTS